MAVVPCTRCGHTEAQAVRILRRAYFDPVEWVNDRFGPAAWNRAVDVSVLVLESQDGPEERKWILWQLLAEECDRLAWRYRARRGRPTR